MSTIHMIPQSGQATFPAPHASRDRAPTTSRSSRVWRRLCRARHPQVIIAVAFMGVAGCSLGPPDDIGDAQMDDGPIAKGIAAPLGEIIPSATAEQRATFARGLAVLQKRFDLGDGLGPTFNVTFCGACHERPVPGGGAALYRNFFLAGQRTDDGAFLFSSSNGEAGGVLRVFHYGEDSVFRPQVPEATTIFAQRNAIPMFGVGLVAEIEEQAILANSDPDDADGDGISGKPNFDRGFVGRFGRKSQTVSIEGFIRGPLFNHLGITTVPLSDDQRARLPVDSSARSAQAVVTRADVAESVPQRMPHQAAAPDAPNMDDDAAPDPEMTADELFDLVSFSMLLAAPEFDEPTARSNAGRLLFHEANCSSCHVPRLDGPRGPIPVYSDLLLHDMGPELADGIIMKDAGGSEFRTQPLWGLSAVGPYLHDGRASTIVDAILAHGGEAQAARDAFEAYSEVQRSDVVEFLLTLGGRAQTSAGLLTPEAAIPEVGEYGGPFRVLTTDEADRFRAGRAVYDRDFNFSDGAGGLVGADGAGRFNGDSCRACHFDPVIGGSGPRDVNVMRHGIVNMDGSFTPPPDTPNTILHKETQIGSRIVTPHASINVFEHRQTPHTFGLGLIDAISEQTIMEAADPEDADGDGISGRVHILSDGRIGRFGWKADVPSVAEFVRDAMAAEIGVTLPPQSGMTFGLTTDTDGVPDPELPLQDVEDLAFFLSHMAGPPRQVSGDPELVEQGAVLFNGIGCSSCHRPVLPSSLGDVALFSDLLLHEILPEGHTGIVAGDAGQREFRTAPLWGLSQTAPYFHSGEADSIDEAIRMHDGEARDIRDAYIGLDAGSRAALLAFPQHSVAQRAGHAPSCPMAGAPLGCPFGQIARRESHTMKQLILSCSLSPTSRSAIMAGRLAHHQVEQGDRVRTIDLREQALPFCDAGACYGDGNVQDLGAAIADADAITLATPIYNYETGGSTRNVIALGGKAFTGKVVGFVVAAGGQGSYMAIMSLANSLMLDFRCIIVPRFVYATGAAFTDEKLTDSAVDERLRELARELKRMGEALA